jgi:hypothetical protein
MSTSIWYRDLKSAFGKDNAHRFVPLRTMNLTQQLNACFRLAVYYSVVTTLLTRNVTHMTVAAIAAVVTAIVHEISRMETFAADAPCDKPTKGNPYMNMTLADLEKRTLRAAACDPGSDAVKSTIADLDAMPLTDGPYENRGSRFYTMPVTTAANDQSGFAQALYGGKQSNAPGARA